MNMHLFCKRITVVLIVSKPWRLGEWWTVAGERCKVERGFCLEWQKSALVDIIEKEGYGEKGWWLEQSLRRKRRKQIWDQKDNWRDCRDPNGNTSFKKKDARMCLNVCREADQGHERTEPYEFLSGAQAMLPQSPCWCRPACHHLVSTLPPDPSQAHPHVRPQQFPKSPRATAFSGWSEDRTLWKTCQKYTLSGSRTWSV